MFNLIITTIEWIVVLVVLAAFVIGAWRHLVAETLGDSLLVDPSPNAKAKGYLCLAGKVLWHMLVPTAMLARIYLEFAADCYSNRDEVQSDSDSDFRYRHNGETYYTHSTGDSSNSWY
jgi:hypothetical protein